MEIVSFLVKGSGSNTYTVSATPDHRLTCTCADQFYRSQENPNHTCKHIRFVAASAFKVPATVV